MFGFESRQKSISRPRVVLPRLWVSFDLFSGNLISANTTPHSVPARNWIGAKKVRLVGVDLREPHSAPRTFQSVGLGTIVDQSEQIQEVQGRQEENFSTIDMLFHKVL